MTQQISSLAGNVAAPPQVPAESPPDIQHPIPEPPEDLRLPAECQPDISHLITEDDTPVDNLPSEKQQRMLTEPLYSSWRPGNERPFLAAANVGVFASVHEGPIVPDMFLSLDVQVSPQWWEQRHRSYLAWEFGKVPDLAVEIVSKTKGGEFGEKLEKYARMKVSYYVVFDPQRYYKGERLTVYALHTNWYQKMTPAPELEGEVYLLTPGLPLGLTLWEGEFEGVHDTWLRWTDEQGNLIPTGKERAERERTEKEAALRLAETERLEKERERAEKEKLLAKLRELGVDPNTI